MLRSRRGPFRPGPGAMPPHLAGREEEQSLFRDVVADLAEGVPPRAEIVLHGPRGNGKTVLLRWVEQEAASVTSLESVWLTPAAMPDRAELAERLLPASWWERLTPKEVSRAGFVWRSGQGDPPPADQVFAARARKNPLVLLLDEAHTLDVELGRVLLNASQVVGRKLPFLLVLAGTPDLETHLNRMGASFWSRAEQLRIGRLYPEATRAAFREPFVGAGVDVTDSALDDMARLSQGYPYFIQLLGDSVWCAGPGNEDSKAVVDRAVVEAAVPSFEDAKGSYYANRLEELDRRRLVAVGRTVAEAFVGRRVLTFHELDANIRLAFDEEPDHERVVAIRDALRDLGYIWRLGPRPEWEPGIPSLMDYVREFVPAP